MNIPNPNILEFCELQHTIFKKNILFVTLSLLISVNLMTIISLCFQLYQL